MRLLKIITCCLALGILAGCVGPYSLGCCEETYVTPTCCNY